MGKFILAVAEQGEILLIDGDKHVEGECLFLVDALLRTFHGIEDGSQVEGTLQEFTDRFGGSEETPLDIDSWKRFFPGESPFLIEVRALRYAVRRWVQERKGPYFHLTSFAAVLFEASPEDLAEGFAVECFLERCKHLYIRPELHPKLFNGQLVTLYTADELLPLAWAEVWYALGHHLRFGVCPFCSGIYPLPKHGPSKTFCGGRECHRAKLIQDHGGIEGYREWERVRKKKRKFGSKRKVGRPKKPVK